jgi:hypothetical protein
VIDGEFHSIKVGGWSSLSDFECNLMKMKESEVVFWQLPQNNASVLEVGSMKLAWLYILIEDVAGLS